jgi:flagellar basal-body rod protein FlgB
MEFTDLRLMSALDQKMHYLGQRQKVLSQNIANANTPGYEPHDLKPFDFKEVVARYQMVPSVSRPQHIMGTLGSPKPFASPEQRRVYESSPDGNEVVMEEQMLKSSHTQQDYMLMSNIYQKQVSMFRGVMRGGQ